MAGLPFNQPILLPSDPTRDEHAATKHYVDTRQVTIGETVVPLGGHVTTLTGLSTVIATAFSGNLVGTADRARKLKDPFTLSFSGAAQGSVELDGSEDVDLNLSLIGNAPSASKWQSAITLSLKGDATGSVSVDGSKDASLNVTVPMRNAPSAEKWVTPRTVTLTGPVTGSVSLDGSKNVSLTTSVSDNTLSIAKTQGLQQALDDKLAKGEATQDYLANTPTQWSASTNKDLDDAPVGSKLIVASQGNANTPGSSNSNWFVETLQLGTQTSKLQRAWGYDDGSARSRTWTQAAGWSAWRVPYEYDSGNLEIVGDIVPDQDNVRSLGSPSKMWRDVYIGPGSLYVNGQKVIDNDDATMRFTADPGQNISIQTKGAADLELKPLGTGLIMLRGPAMFEAGALIRTTDGSPFVFDDPISFTEGTGIVGPLKVDGHRVWDESTFTPNLKLDKDANAVSATKLHTARKINGVLFDGTKDITVSAVLPSTLNFGDGFTQGSFDGSSTKTLYLGTPSTIDGNSVNAVTAESHSHKLVLKAADIPDLAYVKSSDTRLSLLTYSEAQTLLPGSANWSALSGKGGQHVGVKLYANDNNDSFFVASSTDSNIPSEPDLVTLRHQRTGDTTFSGLDSVTVMIDADVDNQGEDGVATLLLSQDGRATQAAVGIDSSNNFYFQPSLKGSGKDYVQRKAQDGTYYRLWDAESFDPSSKLGVGATAVAATKLATARTIAGSAFDGTKNISIAYSNLTGLPALGTASGKDISYFALASHTHSWSDITGKPSFATVATSGKYDDLVGLPSLGTAAAKDASDFATSAQGILAQKALPKSGGTLSGAIDISGTNFTSTHVGFLNPSDGNTGWLYLGMRTVGNKGPYLTVSPETSTGLEAPDLFNIYRSGDVWVSGDLAVAGSISASNIGTAASKDTSFFALASHTHSWSAITGKPSFASVATSGKYADLIGIPDTAPPSGVAGGDLMGTYPNPTVRAISVYDDRNTAVDPKDIRNKAITFDFKAWNKAGNPPVSAKGNSYSHIVNIAGWSGATGGLPSQISVGDGLAVRQATSDTAWGDWRAVWHSGNFTPTDYAKTSELFSGNYADLTGLPSLGTAASKDVSYFALASHTHNWEGITGKPAFGGASGFATLDAQGKLHESQLPSLAIIDTIPVDSEAEMLALNVQRGDVAIRDDIDTSFILATDDPTKLASWKELKTPQTGVRSFKGRSGVVSPKAGDYTFAQLASTPTTLPGYGITDAVSSTETGLGITTVGSNSTFSDAEAWNATPVGFTGKVNSTSAGFPVGASNSYIFKLGNRAQDGWGGFLLDYTSGDFYTGLAADHNLPVWRKLWSDADFDPSSFASKSQLFSGKYADLTGSPDVYTKTSVNNLLSKKADLKGAAFTGTVSAPELRSDDLNGRLRNISVLPADYIESNPINFRFDQDCLRYVNRWGSATITAPDFNEEEIDRVFSQFAAFINLKGKPDQCAIEVTDIPSQGGSANRILWPFILLHSAGQSVHVKMECLMGGYGGDPVSWETAYDGVVSEYHIETSSRSMRGLTGARWTFYNDANPGQPFTANLYIRYLGVIARNGDAYKWSVVKGGDTMYGDLTFAAGTVKIGSSANEVWHAGNFNPTDYVKPNQLFSGAYQDLTGRPTLGTASAKAISYFATASHNHDASDITTGTLPKARLSGTYDISITGGVNRFSGETVLSSADDLNDILDAGLYSWPSSIPANAPGGGGAGGTWAQLTVTARAGDSVQTVTYVTSGNRYYRTSSGSNRTWNAWQRVWTDKVIDPSTLAKTSELFSGKYADLTGAPDLSQYLPTTGGAVTGRLTLGYSVTGSLVLEGGTEPNKILIGNPDNTAHPYTVLTARDNDDFGVEVWSSSTENNIRKVLRVAQGQAYVSTPGGAEQRLYNTGDFDPSAFAKTTQLFSGKYSDLTGSPTLGSAAAKDTSYFATASHTHAASDITSGTFAAALIPNLNANKITAGTIADARLPTTATRWPSWSEVTSKPSFADVATSGVYSDLTGLPALGTASAKAISYFALASHTHSWGEVTGKPTFASVATSGKYSDLSGLPTLGSAASASTSDFAPANHSHAWGDITGKPAQATRWPSWTEVSSKPAISTNNQGSSLVERDSSGDIHCRLLRSEYTSTNASIGYFLTQVETGTGNNYARPSTPAQAWNALKGYIGNDYLPVAGGTLTGLLICGASSISDGIDMANHDLLNVNRMTINDPGVNEGIEWLGGNGWQIFESPDSMTNAKGNLQFTTGNTRRMTIDTDGTIEANRIRLNSTTDASLSSTGHAFQIGPSNGTNLILDGNEIMSRSNGGTGSLYIQWDGGTASFGGTCTATDHINSSDRRLKHDIVYREARPYLADQLRWANYRWNKDDSNGQGPIAQDVREIAPDHVTVGKSPGDDPVQNPLAIDKANLALEAVIGLASRVRELEAQLANTPKEGFFKRFFKAWFKRA